jgi:hypothetical protein
VFSLSLRVGLLASLSLLPSKLEVMCCFRKNELNF